MDDISPFPIIKAISSLHLGSSQGGSLSAEVIDVNTVTACAIVKDINTKGYSSNKFGEHNLMIFAPRKVQETKNHQGLKLFDATLYGMTGAGEFPDFGMDANDGNSAQESLVKPVSYL